jgi:hypothetical protein
MAHLRASGFIHVEIGLIPGAVYYEVQDQPNAVADLTEQHNLLERSEVVTIGSSVSYGPDAVAGVVNFILKDRLEGF